MYTATESRYAEVPDALKAPAARARGGGAASRRPTQELLLQFTKLASWVDNLACLVDVNITLTLIVLGKLFLAP